MSVNQITEDRVESQFSGSALRRLLTYVKPFWHYMAVSLLLVLLLIIVFMNAGMLGVQAVSSVLGY